MRRGALGSGLAAEVRAHAPADRDGGGPVGRGRWAMVGIGEGVDALELGVDRGGEGEGVKAIALTLELGRHLGANLRAREDALQGRAGAS